MTGPVTLAYCNCPVPHSCYRADIRECYEFADGPDGLCARCRGAAGAQPDTVAVLPGRDVENVVEML